MERYSVRSFGETLLILPYRKVYHFAYRVIRREHFAFLDSLPDHAVQRLYRVSCVDRLADIGRITKEGIEIFPVGPPAFADLRIFTIPGVRERIQRHLCFRKTMIKNIIMWRMSLYFQTLHL